MPETKVYDGDTLWITADEFQLLHPLDQWICPNCYDNIIQLEKQEQHRLYMACVRCRTTFTRRCLSLIANVKGDTTGIIPNHYSIKEKTNMNDGSLNFSTVQESPDLKFDQDKPIAGALTDFSLALMELSKLLTFGAKEYERSSWLEVRNNEIRYKDALWRHLLSPGTDEKTGLGHDVAVVFNALATLELRLRREANEA